MKDRYYLTNPGKLVRQDNTLYFETDNKKTPIPVNKIYDIYATENVSISSGVFVLLEEHKVPLHTFSYGGKFLGSFLPPERIRSGVVTVEQAETYNSSERLVLATEFVRGASENMEYILKRFNGWTEERGEELSELRKSLDFASSIPNIMEIEGKIHKIYYNGISESLEETQFDFHTRSREPPEDEVNAVLSYVNTLVYSRIVTELYYTRLDQSISFLHEPSERRFSLSLDIAEIYKPLLGHKVMLSLFKQGILSKSDFEEEGRAVLLSEEGRKKVLKEFDEQLNTTKKHPGTNEPVRWRRWIRIEGYKLTKYILDMEPYNPTSLE